MLDKIKKHIKDYFEGENKAADNSVDFNHDDPCACNVAAEKVVDLYSYDNCNSETNGEFSFLSFYAKSFSLCFDIGANDGAYSKKILTENPNCHVISFEPNSDLIDSIREKGVKDVYNVAVADRDGFIKINIDKSDDTQSSSFRKNDNTIEIEVPSITIDSFCEKNKIDKISFIKIDTEGNELAVIRGARRIIGENIADFIQFEYGGTFKDANIKLGEIFDLMKENYMICHVTSVGLFPLMYSDVLENYRYSNWVAVSRKVYR